jgi:DNA-binding transcriptional ArsR family regulator
MVVDSLSVTLSAVADPTRRAILKSLVDGPAPVTELARPYRMSQQAVSKHVAYLEKARLIEKRRDGRLHICKLTPAPLKEIAEWTEKYRQYWEASFQRLDALLDELQGRTKAPGRKRPHSRSDR